ncbi:MAG: phosphatidate cytidylyltransferase [Bacteroidetes bacterium]|jgi:phosphatidate cytidylyltransferase|nr:phosphatidate cytidylyltransferase [Bacteroidota bacterium]
MSEIVLRTISGVLYVSIIILAMFASREWFLGLFFMMAILTVNEFVKLVRVPSIFAYLVLILAFYFIGWNEFPVQGVKLFLVLTIFVNSYLLKDLLWTNKIQIFENRKHILTYFYIIGGFVFLTLIPTINNDFSPHLIIFVFVLIWANDTFAYLIGKSFGKHKLLERISPKKTIEGFFGGMTGAIIAGLVIYFLTNQSEYMEKPLDNLWVWIVLAVIIAIFGTIGDLIQSKIKRQAGVKDSGTIMPGHGGIYDRLDSIIYASPFVYAFLLIANYVS